MTNPEQAEIARKLARLATLLGVQVDTAVLADYLEALAGLSFRQLDDAITIARQTCARGRFPSPGELRRIVYRPGRYPEEKRSQKALDFAGVDKRRAENLVPLRQVLEKLGHKPEPPASRMSSDELAQRKAELRFQADGLRRQEQRG